MAVLVGDERGERGAHEQGHLQGPVGGVDAEQHHRQDEQTDQDRDRRQRIEKMTADVATGRVLSECSASLGQRLWS